MNGEGDGIDIDLFCPHLNLRESFTVRKTIKKRSGSSSGCSQLEVDVEESVRSSLNNSPDHLYSCNVCFVGNSEAHSSIPSASKMPKSTKNPLLWKCLAPKCGLYFCGSRGGQNHAQDHFLEFPNHPLQENSVSRRIWCNSCDHEVLTGFRNRRRPPAIWYPPYENEESPPRGLYNIGNTCFMNAALQAMVSVLPLTSYFNGSCSSLAGKSISTSYLWLLSELWSNRETAHKGVIPSRLLHSIRTAHPIFRGFQQHDTQEFLRLFMDSLFEETKIPHFYFEEPPKKRKGKGKEEGKKGAGHDEETSSASETESFETCDSGNASEETMSLEQNGDGDGIKVKKSEGVTVPQEDPRDVRVVLKSIVSDIFDGGVESSVQCLSCKQTSRRLEVFQDLSLPIPTREELSAIKVSSRYDANSALMVRASHGWLDWAWDWVRSWIWGPAPSLEDCFSAFFSSDELKGKNMYSCEQCKKLRNGVKRCTLYSLPEILCVHLKRFRMYEFSGGIGLSSKISQYVHFPIESLDLKPFLHKDCKNQVTTYRLQGAICHLGSFLGGHYISYIRKGDGWWLCDDSRVVPVSPETVAQSEAYVLFYQQWNEAVDDDKTDLLQTWNAAEEEIGDPNQVKFHLISRKWLTMYFLGEERTPLDNSDVVCPHGKFAPNENAHLGATWIPDKLWNFIMEKYGGGPDLTSPSDCSICTQALRKHLKLAAAKGKTPSQPHIHLPPHIIGHEEDSS